MCESQRKVSRIIKIGINWRRVLSLAVSRGKGLACKLCGLQSCSLPVTALSHIPVRNRLHVVQSVATAEFRPSVHVHTVFQLRSYLAFREKYYICWSIIRLWKSSPENRNLFRKISIFQ